MTTEATDRIDELRSLIAEAVLASAKAVVENVDVEKYLPSSFSDYPSEVTLWEESEMPKVASKGILERPTDYTRLFVRDPEKSDHQSISYDSIPELVALMSWIIDQPDLVELFAPPRVPERKEFDLDEVPIHASVVEDQAFDLALEIVDHLAYTTGLDEIDSDRVNELAESVAFGLLGPEPKIEILAPVLLTRFEVEDRIDLGAGLYIEKLSDLFIREKAWTDSRDHLEVTLGNCATHALVQSGYYLLNRKRLFRDIEASGVWPWEGIDLFVECLRAVTGVHTGYKQVVVRPVGWQEGFRADLRKLVRNIDRDNYPDSVQSHGWLRPTPLITRQQVETANSLFEKISKLKNGHAVRVALRRLSSGMLRADQSDALLDYCIGLEALLGEDLPGEVTHKLSLRTAAVIRANNAEFPAKDVFDAVKSIYRSRSKVVHGRTAKPPDVEIGERGKMSTTEAALLLLRRSLQAVIPRPALWETSRIDDILVLGSMDDMPDQLDGFGEEE